MRALDLQAEGALEFSEQDEERRHLRGEDRAGGAPPRSAAARRRAGGKVAPSTRMSAPTWRPPGGERLGVRRADAGVDGRLDRSRRAGGERGRAAARLRRRHAAARCRPAARRQADAGRRLPARPPAAGLVSAAEQLADRVSRALLAFATVRATFEDGRLHRARLPRRGRRGSASTAATVPRPSGSPTAPCSDAAPATSRSNASPAARPGCSTRRCWRRCASASTSCSSPTRPPTTPPSTRRSSWSRRRAPRHAAGFANAILRRAGARARGADGGAARRRLDSGRRRGRRLGAEVAGRDVVGGAGSRGRPLGACRLQPARRGGDADQLAAQRPRGDGGAPARARGWRQRSPRPRGRWRLQTRSSSRAALARRCRRLIAAGELTPQSRGSAAVVEVLDPQPGRAGPRPLRRARDQDRPDRRADGRPRRGDLGRARSGAGRRSRRPGERLGLRSVTVIEADAKEAAVGDGLRPRPPRCALLGPRHARLAARRPLAQVAAGDRARWPRSRTRYCAAPPRSCAPAAPSSTRPARSPAARTRSGSRGCSGAPGPARCRRCASTTSAPRLPRWPRRPSRAACRFRPDRDRTTGFFIARLRRGTDR